MKKIDGISCQQTGKLGKGKLSGKWVMKKQERYVCAFLLPFFFSTGIQQAELDGEDYERVKMLETSASELERRDRKKKKKNPDTGFAGE